MGRTLNELLEFAHGDPDEAILAEFLRDAQNNRAFVTPKVSAAAEAREGYMFALASPHAHHQLQGTERHAAFKWKPSNLRYNLLLNCMLRNVLPTLIAVGASPCLRLAT